MSNKPPELGSSSLLIEESKVDPRWVRANANRAVFWTLTPFILALSWFVGFRVVETKRAFVQIHSLAEAVTREIQIDSSRSTQDVVDSLMAKGGYPRSSTEDQKNFRALIRILHLQATLSHATPQIFLEDLKRQADLRLHAQTLGISFVGAMFLSIFPGTLVMSLVAARNRHLRLVEEGITPAVSRSFLEAVRYKRSHWLIKNESRPFFCRRFAFAWFHAFGISYLLAPGGFINATTVAYIYLHSPPSEPTLNVWFEQFRYIPPLLAGFAGFFL